VNSGVIYGDAERVLKTLPPGIVQCCVTSPPYWGLRDYSVAGQFGLEKTPEEYIERMVGVFREVWRVLRDDGTVFLNLGDSYATQGGRGEARMCEQGKPSIGALTNPLARGAAPGIKGGAGLKPKDLCMIPARVALALQADGWVLRQEIIWFKKNCMPESVNDRCTRSHEQIYMFGKAVWSKEKWTMPILASKEDLIWLATIIDAEGSICINKKKNGSRLINPTYASRICCYNCHKPIIDRIVHITNMGRTQERKDSKNRMVFQWQVAGPKAIPIIVAIEPYLMAKRRAAWAALELQLLNKHWGNKSGWGGGAKEKPQEIIKRQKELYDGCSELNKTGNTDVALKEWNGKWKTNKYFYDSYAIREEAAPIRMSGVNNALDHPHTPDPRKKQDALGKNTYTGFNARWADSPRAGRNKRTVWEIPTAPYPGAHFATFPPALVEPCILAGTSPRACEKCGAPWKRLTEKSRSFESGSGRSGRDPIGKNGPGLQGGGETRDIRRGPCLQVETTGWQPTCSCDNEGKGRCLVLDPFAGSGTTGEVALKHGRDYLLIELNRDYETLIRGRLGLFYSE